MIEVKETEDGVTITNRLCIEVEEKFDRFIFLSVEPYLRDMTRFVISKELLMRALVCFRNEHPDEFKHLQAKMNPDQ